MFFLIDNKETKPNSGGYIQRKKRAHIRLINREEDYLLKGTIQYFTSLDFYHPDKTKHKENNSPIVIHFIKEKNL